MIRSIKYRIYPNKIQKAFIEKSIGHCRFVYNAMLTYQDFIYKNRDTYPKQNKILSDIDMYAELPNLKIAFPFLKECNAQSLQYAAKQAHTAYQRFFKKISKHPRFKKKSHSGSFHVPQGFKFKNNKLKIFKLKQPLTVKIHKSINGTIRNLTITKTSTDKYYVSVCYKDASQINPHILDTKEEILGLDLGITNLIVDSNGKTYSNPKALFKYLSKIKYLNKQLSKKKKGSKNREKTRLKLAKVHEKVKNIRLDYSHQLTSSIVNNNQVSGIVIENLKASNMMKNGKIAKHIQDASFYEIRRQLEYKCKFINKGLSIVDPKNTSKTCSNCDTINSQVKWGMKTWTCSSCNHYHSDRDHNAAINIKNLGLKDLGFLNTVNTLRNLRDSQSLNGKTVGSTALKLLELSAPGEAMKEEILDTSGGVCGIDHKPFYSFCLKLL